MAKKSEIISSAAMSALTNKEGRAQEEYPEPKPMDTFKIDPLSDKMKNHTLEHPNFTGIARSVVCYKNQGYSNFRIHTLYIENGEVVKMDISDPWANFETAAILENVSHISMIHLNNTFEDGKAFDK